ncbi:hypothetical protein [Amycolatopsis sp. VC5-11]|uniref:hypothetical protein n=1 Tax=Amycolatopsis sp. VC5-11 TaxID=3120156 RepID=UPI00300837AD
MDGSAVPPADAESAGSQVATILTCAWTDGSQVLGRTVELGLPDLHALVRRAGDPVGPRRFAWSRQVCGAGGSLALRRQLVPSARYGAGGGLALQRQPVPGGPYGAVLQRQLVPGDAVRRGWVISRWSARVEGSRRAVASASPTSAIAPLPR